MAERTHVTSDSDKDGHRLQLQHQEVDTPILPQPDTIKGYVEIDPLAFKWIMEQTEKESEYRRQRVKTVNGYTFTSFTLGQVFGFLIGLFGLSLAAYCGLHGAEITGSVIGGTTIVGLTYSFVANGHRKK